MHVYVATFGVHEVLGFVWLLDVLAQERAEILLSFVTRLSFDLEPIGEQCRMYFRNLQFCHHRSLCRKPQSQSIHEELVVAFANHNGRICVCAEFRYQPAGWNFRSLFDDCNELILGDVGEVILDIRKGSATSKAFVDSLVEAGRSETSVAAFLHASRVEPVEELVGIFLSIAKERTDAPDGGGATLHRKTAIVPLSSPESSFWSVSSVNLPLSASGCEGTGMT